MTQTAPSKYPRLRLYRLEFHYGCSINGIVIHSCKESNFKYIKNIKSIKFKKSEITDDVSGNNPKLPIIFSIGNWKFIILL